MDKPLDARFNTPAKFWAKVEITAGCWLWCGSKTRGGYGLVRWFRRSERAHRRAWMLINGEIPRGRWVLHRCDTPACVRPDHLFLGTRRDNVDDCLNKNRQAQGQALSQAVAKKLNPATVREIRAALARGESQRAIAKRYHVHQFTISGINTKRLWRWLQ